MSLLALVPLFFTLIVALFVAFYFIKRRTLAQAQCVHAVTQLQWELKSTLDQLLRLNRSASQLRQQRSVADRNWEAAVSSGVPYAIAATAAVRAAVILAQLALRAKQEALLLRARQQRISARLKLGEIVRAHRIGPLTAQTYYVRALAVEAKPADSLTPDYQPVPQFTNRQVHRFRFLTDLSPRFALPWFRLPRLQAWTECAASLTGEEKAWRLELRAAKAAWN